jgi:hypothetical protein
MAKETLTQFRNHSPELSPLSCGFLGLWKGRHAALVDGFIFTVQDSPLNQAVSSRASQKMAVFDLNPLS